MTTADGNQLAGLIPERVDSGTTVPYRAALASEVDPFLKIITSEVLHGHRSRRRSDKVGTSIELCSSIQYDLETSLKIDRTFGKYEVSIVEPRMHEQHHKRTEAVIGDLSM